MRARDGRTLFYRSARGVMAAPLVPAEDLEFAVPEALFPDTDTRTQAGAHVHFDVAPDGRFLLISDPLADSSGAAAAPIADRPWS